MLYLLLQLSNHILKFLHFIPGTVTEGSSWLLLPFASSLRFARCLPHRLPGLLEG